MTCNKSDVEKLFIRFFLKSSDKLHTCFHGVRKLDILSVEVFVELVDFLFAASSSSNVLKV